MSHAPKLTGSGRIIGMSDSHVEIDSTRFVSAEWHQGYYDLLHVAGGVRVTIEPIDASEPAPVPTIEQIKERLRDALPNYRKLGYQPIPKHVIADISAEVAKMIEEARR